MYRQQGVDINDKHIEVIVRQMMRKVRVEDANDTGCCPAPWPTCWRWRTRTQRSAPHRRRGEVREDGEPLQEATYTQLLMGITKASLATDSFLSAASFQETTKVLTEAAIKGQGGPPGGPEGERHHRQTHSPPPAALPPHAGGGGGPSGPGARRRGGPSHATRAVRGGAGGRVRGPHTCGGAIGTWTRRSSPESDGPETDTWRRAVSRNRTS